MADPVQLTDLDVITRYSIAVRSATADRDELLATLRADLAWLERGRPRSAPSYAASRDYDEPEYDEEVEEAEPEPPRTPIRRMAMPPARRTTTRSPAKSPARKTAAKKASSRSTSAKKTAAKKTTRRSR